MTILVRQAGAGDLDALTALFDGYRQFYRQPSDPDGARAFLAERIERGDSTIFLAEDDTGALGFTQLYPSFTSTGMKRILILNDLFVAPAARGKGVGAALLRHAAQFGRREGAARLVLSTATDNFAAQSVYEREGWERDDAFLTYKLPLAWRPLYSCGCPKLTAPMAILVTGSAGHLGEALMRILRGRGEDVRGLDIKPSGFTDLVGTIADRDIVRDAMRGVRTVLHTATLHKPHVVTHSHSQFVEANVTGTLNLLEEAAEAVVGAFVQTSTTSAFGDALSPPPGTPAAWIVEDVLPIPKNIYGATKLAAEHLCRVVARKRGLPVVVLRTSRFFPEEDDKAEIREAFSQDNMARRSNCSIAAAISRIWRSRISPLRSGPRRSGSGWRSSRRPRLSRKGTCRCSIPMPEQ